MSQQTESSPQPHILRACYGLSALCILHLSLTTILTLILSLEHRNTKYWWSLDLIQGLWDSQIYALFMSLKSQTPAEGGWVLERCHPAALLLKGVGHEKIFVLLRPLAGLQGLEAFPHPSQWERTFSVLQVWEQDEEKSSLCSRIPAYTENVKNNFAFQKVNPLGHDVLLLILCIVGFDLEKSLKKFYIFVHEGSEFSDNILFWVWYQNSANY